MAEDIKSGDIVYLKSGSPALTVGRNNITNISSEEVQVEWFQSGVVKHAVLSKVVLTKTKTDVSE